ncbi:MAG TPA: type II toxin-antitoxin system VapC family toxin [Caulobacteraceae bacterium]
MRLILDTHVLIWIAIEPEHLSPGIRSSLQRGGDEVYISAVSAYEIDLKRPRDPKLAGFPDDVESYAASIGLTWLSVTASQASDAARLPLIHRDPWDRLIIAQARAIDAAVLTVDPWIRKYPVTTIW